ncbi:MAG: PIG-L deacetylase family protein [Candidatus Woesearchaeota archaeon]
MVKRIIIICAHADDQILGAGGTMAKYASEGYEVRTLIMSKGEGSHPHLKPKVVTRMRFDETRKAHEIIGCPHFDFYDLKEGAFEKDAVEQGTHDRLAKLFDLVKPEKVFTHSHDDVQIPGNDHRAINHIVLKAWEMSESKPALYTFDVWNPWSFKSRIRPRIVVDVSTFFGKKMEALKAFKSQKIQMQIPLTGLVYARAIFHGFMNNMRYAEVFYRLR